MEGYRFHSGTYRNNISELLQKLQIHYRDISLYEQAFVHRSFLNESRHFPDHNERLEFLGDAVLELVVTDVLFKKFPEKKEGWMTDIRSSLVRGKNLEKISSKIGLNKYLLLSRWERISGGETNPSILADVLESFIGALYLDIGFSPAFTFINAHIIPTLDDIFTQKLHIDPKTQLQELVQAKSNVTPRYILEDEKGKDHEKVFQISVYKWNMKLGTGTGTNKKKAQEAAASDALIKKLF